MKEDCEKCAVYILSCVDCKSAEVSESTETGGYTTGAENEEENFNYVNITSTGCEGWLNLFFGERCVTLIRDVEMANKMRLLIAEKKSV